jgi:hypothetical protein
MEGLPGPVHQGEHVAAHATCMGFDDVLDKCRSRGRVDSIAAAPQHVGSGGRGSRVARGDPTSAERV